MAKSVIIAKSIWLKGREYAIAAHLSTRIKTLYEGRVEFQMGKRDSMGQLPFGAAKSVDNLHLICNK